VPLYQILQKFDGETEYEVLRGGRKKFKVLVFLDPESSNPTRQPSTLNPQPSTLNPQP